MTVFLADTHIFLWAIDEFERLTPPQAEVWKSDAEIWFSHASLWEMSIKASLNKLKLPGDLIPTVLGSRLDPQPIGLHHIERLRDLPHYHGDPFDRMLIAQAMTENMVILTADRQFRAYDIAVL